MVRTNVYHTLPRFELPVRGRVWVVGNGPSLMAEDLNKLHEHGETCIGMNRIHLMYDKTPWRPDYYCLGDAKSNKRWRDDLLLHVNQGYPCFIKDQLLVDMTPRCQKASGSWIDEDWADSVVPLVQCKHDYIDVRPPRRWHLPYLCCFGGSMNLAIQLGAYLGVGTIVLVGVDHLWQPHTVRHTPDPNHFDERYDGTLDSVGDADWSVLTRRDIEQAQAEAVLLHRLALREAEERGLEIVNASRNTALEAYPKVCLDDWLN